MNTKRSPGLVCAVTALLILALAVPGLAAESPPTILWDVTSIAGSAVGVGPDGHAVAAGSVCNAFPILCNIRVVKHDASTGAVIWSVILDASGLDEPFGVAIGADGHPVVTGTSCGPNFADCNIRTVKLEAATGAVLWSMTFTAPGGGGSAAVAIGADGNPVVTGGSCLPDASS